MTSSSKITAFFASATPCFLLSCVGSHPDRCMPLSNNMSETNKILEILFKLDNMPFLKSFIVIQDGEFIAETYMHGGRSAQQSTHPHPLVVFAYHHTVSRLTLSKSLDAVYFVQEKRNTTTTKQSTNEVRSWPKIKLKIIQTTEMKDTLIPAKPTLSVKNPTRIWDVTWESM